MTTPCFHRGTGHKFSLSPFHKSRSLQEKRAPPSTHLQDGLLTPHPWISHGTIFIHCLYSKLIGSNGYRPPRGGFGGLFPQDFLMSEICLQRPNKELFSWKTQILFVETICTSLRKWGGYLCSLFTLRDAWMSKKGLCRTLNGSLVLSICPVFIFSKRGEIISFSMHNRRVLKLHWPTGCPCKMQHTRTKISHPSTLGINLFIHICMKFLCTHAKMPNHYQCCVWTRYFQMWTNRWLLHCHTNCNVWSFFMTKKWKLAPILVFVKQSLESKRKDQNCTKKLVMQFVIWVLLGKQW